MTEQSTHSPSVRGAAELRALFEDHYWDSLAHVQDIVMLHVNAVLDLAGWRPIASAPKDRTIIITGRYPNGRAYVEESCWSPRGHFTARKFDAPTHWMPMPEPYGGWDLEQTSAEREKS